MIENSHLNFNPHTTQGSTFWVVPCIVIMLVSIHAPTQGATCARRLRATRIGCFNPRTHTGCDFLAVGLLPNTGLFQSTHPHGVRPFLFIQNFIFMSVSIHAPTRGATTQALYVWSSIPVSIHAPTRGATRCRCTPTRSCLSFNPRTHTGCDFRPTTS